MKSWSNLFIWLLLIVLASCSFHKQNSSSEEFDAFYERFLNDTTFQLDRVQFPLPNNSVSSVDRIPSDIAEELGINEEGKDTGEYWTRSNWIILKNIELDTTLYRRELNKSDSVVSERIYINASGFEVQSKFKLVDGKWVLIYFYESNF